jgi:ATP-dependent Clp protease ATP-binding subunit ClpC
VFERFTERARQAIVIAQDEARALRHGSIGPEHILLGLLRVHVGLVARALDSFDMSSEEVRVQVARVVGEGDEVRTGQIPFTPSAKKTLELGLREALALGHDYIGTEHLLLALARIGDEVVAPIMRDFDLDAEKFRDEAIRTGAREYDVKTLDGASDTWAAQLAEGHGDGWEVISVVHEGDAVRAILERRRRAASA